MIKKLFTLVLFIGMLLLVPTTYGATEIIYGVEFELYDETGIAFDFNLVSEEDRLYIQTLNEDYHDTIWFENGIRVPTIYAEQFLLESQEVDIQTLATGIEHTVKIGFTLYPPDNDYLNNYFDILVIETLEKQFYRFVPRILSGGMRVDFNYVFQLEDDNGINVVTDTWQRDFYINDVLFTPPTTIIDDWSTVQIYFTNVLPDENLFYQTEFAPEKYWMGYGIDSFHTSFSTSTAFAFTENYFLKYVNQFILPYTSSLTDAENQVFAYREKIRNDGINVDIPPSFNMDLFIPNYFTEGFSNWWYKIQSPNAITQVNIKVPDLILDGSVSLVGSDYVYTGEIWGQTLVYTVNTVEYDFNLTDEFNNELVPIFGFKTSSEYYLLTFNSTGGVPQTMTKWVGSGQLILGSPQLPTRAEYVFKGWTTSSTMNHSQPYGSTVEGTYLRGTNNIATQDITFYAIWHKVAYNIHLDLNGGSLVIHPNFTSPRLIVESGKTALQNYRQVPFNDMVRRDGYALVGWYLDEAFTTPFNASAPITETVTIYANWVESTVSSETPSVINQLLINMGLFNTGGFILIFVIIYIILFSLSLAIGLPPMALIIELILLVALFMFMGFFELWALIIIILAIVLGVLIEIRR